MREVEMSGISEHQKRIIKLTVSVVALCSAAVVAQPKAGVNGNIEIVRLGIKGKLLHVSDMIEIRNGTALTQTGEKTFEVYLPPQAKLTSVLAAGPDSVPVHISATSVSGEPGHWAVNFPLKPGPTRFAFNYDLAYDGHVQFHPKSLYGMQQFAVMMPPTMKFSGSRAFQLLATGKSEYRVEAASPVAAGVGPDFEVSGSGPLPPLPQSAESMPTPPAAVPQPAASAAPNRQESSAKLGSAVVLSRQQWWALGGSTISMLALWGWLLRYRMRKFVHQEPSGASPLEALKQAMFQLEADRVDGNITVDDYATAKRALENTVHRAIARRT
jgi:hypothetical protein